MNVRWGIATAVLATVATGLVPASAATAPELPRAVCTHRVADSTGDAFFDPGGTTVADGVTGPVPAADITGLDLRVTGDAVEAFLGIVSLPANGSGMPAYSGTYRYLVTFTAKGKAVTLGAELVNPTWTSAKPSDSASYPMANVGTTHVAGATAGFYPGAGANPGYVGWVLPRAAFETLLGAPLADGDTITALYGKTESHAPGAGTSSPLDDTTVPAADAVWTVGDDYCFGAPPAQLSDITLPDTQYGDTAELDAVLSDEDGAGLAGKPVTFAFGGTSIAPVRATTDADGVASVMWPVSVPAGTYTVTVAFAGDAEAGKAKDTGTMTITVERTSFGPLAVARTNNTARTVTATLLDDDKKPVAGQKVDWYVNGKKVATVPTAAAGKSVYKGAKAGQTVQAKFAGAAGRYVAAASKPAKV
jgi:hypothetical protein